MQLYREAVVLQSRGATLHLVGIGSPAVIQGFRADTGITAPVYADPTFATYRALGMRRGTATFLSFGFLRNAWRARRAGYRNVSIAGDPVQHGGVLVVRQDGSVAYRYLSRTAGDHPPVRDILGAL